MRIAICLVACAALAAACSSSSSTPKQTSTVQGTVASATFASGAPSAVDAIDESGARTHVVIAADGAFSMNLAKAHVYRVVAITPAGEEPLVFPRAGGRLDTTFRLSSGAAVVGLGNVRHFDSAPKAFSVVDDGLTQCEGGNAGANDQGGGECENGIDAKTGQACTDDGQGGNDADPAKPMAVPEKNPPNDVGGCEDGSNDGEQADD
jgi:hypothetical protein